MIQERMALVLRARKEDLCWRLLGREAPKGGGWAECEWVEGRLYPALAIHFAAPDAAAAPSRPCTETLCKEGESPADEVCTATPHETVARQCE